MEQFNDPFLIEDITDYIDKIAPGNYAAKASVDIALHDLAGKIVGEPWYKLWVSILPKLLIQVLR